LEDPQIEVARLARERGARVVGIGGAPGSGKSTLAREAAEELGDVLVVSLDDYYLSKTERAERGLKWRGPPGSHDVHALTTLLDRFRNHETPLVVARFSPEIDDRVEPESIDRLPRVLILEGMLLGHRGDGYGAILDRLDLLVFLDVPTDVARERRFSRERKLDGGFDENEMEAFWDEVLQPVIDDIIPGAKAAADVVIRDR